MTFAQRLLSPTNRPRVVAAISAVIDDEVREKKGLGAMVLKGAYAGVRGLAAGLVTKAIDAMLPDVAAGLEPFWETRGETPFGIHLRQHCDGVADALLAVSDAKADSIDNAALIKLYRGVRGKAKGHVVDALPRLGAALEQFRV